ncbi:MAG: cbb3-type cytochrome oxidase subunit 3 [Bdellovibrionales bacterium]
MKAEGLKYFSDSPIMVIGLLIFVTCFLGYVLWVNRKGSTDFYQRIASLPLNEPDSAKENHHVGHK